MDNCWLLRDCRGCRGHHALIQENICVRVGNARKILILNWPRPEVVAHLCYRCPVSGSGYSCCLYANASLLWQLDLRIRINISIGRTLHYPPAPLWNASPIQFVVGQLFQSGCYWQPAMENQNETQRKLLKINFETNLQNATCNCCVLQLEYFYPICNSDSDSTVVGL